jgi:deoxyribose-phosphate aldolase
VTKTLPATALTSARAIAALIDHTLLKPEATAADVERLCREALQAEFASVCINPVFVPKTALLLTGSPVRTCTVVGFPLGATLTRAKVDEAGAALEEGAQEIDMVIHIGALKAGDNQSVAADIRSVVEACHSGQAICKVIVETSLLSDEEKERACRISRDAGADFVKTSTGFSTGGATIADVALMRRVVGPDVGVKASGGIRGLEDLLKMVEAGATRIGTSSGVKIMEEARKRFGD